MIITNKDPEELLTFEQLAKEIDPTGNLGITKNTIIKWTKLEENPLQVTEFSPNKRFIKRKDYWAFRDRNSKIDKPKESEIKNDDVESLKVLREKAEIQSGIDRANADIAESLMRKRFAEANIKKIDEIENISKDFENKFRTLEEQKTTLQVDLAELDKRTKEVELREYYISEQSSKIEEILKREHSINDRDNKITEQENSINTLKTGYQNTINELEEQLRITKELYENQILHVKNLKLDMQLIQCYKCSRLKKHADCDLAQLLSNN